MSLSQNEAEKQALLTELQVAGIKYTSNQIVCIGRMANGKIIFLEEGKVGKGGSGLAHILQEHEVDFRKRGIAPEQVPALVMAALTQGQLLGYQGTREPRREIYGIVFEGRVQHVAISVGNNGYIVGANPAT